MKKLGNIARHICQDEWNAKKSRRSHKTAPGSYVASAGYERRTVLCLCAQNQVTDLAADFSHRAGMECGLGEHPEGDQATEAAAQRVGGRLCKLKL